MRIELLTIWKIENFGAELQTYATVKALKQLGCDVEVIDFPLNAKKTLSIKERVINLIQSVTPSRHKFRQFWRLYIPSTKRCYKDEKQLSQNPPVADVYMVGSDQVWNPDITKERFLSYFLCFVNNDARRVSYASSFGISEWSFGPEKTELIKSCLDTFSAISCREADGVRILKDEFSIDAIEVLDPSLLFDGYSELTGDMHQNTTLAFYSIFKNPSLRAFAHEIAKKKGLLFQDANKTSYWLNQRIWNRPSVEGWIKTIGESEYVITDSFHGTVLSLLHKKQFVVIYKGTKSSRITNLLSHLSLMDYYFESVDFARERIDSLQPIDYTVVQHLLDSLREHSWTFLRNAIFMKAN